MDSLTQSSIQKLSEKISKLRDTADKRAVVYQIATDIFVDRNAKYKDAWRDYRIGTFVDRNLVKAKRLRSLDELGDMEEVLEQALDQVNENLFLAILILENMAEGK